MRMEAQTGQRGELTFEAAGSLGSGEAGVPHNGILSSTSESQAFKNVRLKIEIASNTSSSIFTTLFYLGIFKKWF